MKHLCSFLFGSLTLISSLARAGGAQAPLPTVEHVELQRYLGTWYEIARLPNRFEEDCYAVTATYRERSEGKIDVLNSCRKGGFEGDLDEARGRARVVDTASNAKLKVSFFWPFSGDYWILDLDADYTYALVGEPGRKYLWILSRTPRLAPDLYEKLLAKANALGFDTSKIIVTPQNPPN